MCSIPTGVKLEGEELNSKADYKKQKGPFLLTRETPEKTNVYLSSGKWTLIENAKYAAFIEENIDKMEGKLHGKLWLVHQEMSRFIKSRNFRQCKLHHQEMINMFGSIPKVISHLISSNVQFQSLLKEQKQNLQTCINYENQRKKKFNTSSNIQEIKKLSEENLDQVSTDMKYQPEKLSEQRRHQRKTIIFPSFRAKKGLHSESQINARGWIQCQDLFLSWTTQLNQLMKDSSQLS